LLFLGAPPRLSLRVLPASSEEPWRSPGPPRPAPRSAWRQQQHRGAPLALLVEDLVAARRLRERQAVREEPLEVEGLRYEAREHALHRGARRRAAGPVGEVLVVDLAGSEGELRFVVHARGGDRAARADEAIGEAARL